MSNPESSEQPPETTPEQPPETPQQAMDRLLDAYIELRRDIEEHGLDKLRIAQRQRLENDLELVRTRLPKNAETDPLSRDATKRFLADAYRQGRSQSILWEESKKIEDVTPEFLALEEDKRSHQEKIPTNKEANMAVEAEVFARVGDTPPTEEEIAEVTETNPGKLAKTIAGLDNEISLLLRDMESDVLQGISDYREALNKMSTEQLKYLQLVARTRGSYLNWEETVYRAYPGSDLAIPESLTNVPVEDLRDIVAAIRMNIGMLTRLRKDYHEHHPHKE